MSRPKILRHMSRHDEQVFASYVFTPEGQSYTSWEFDVLIGDPDDPGAFYPANLRRAALYQNALKIDAIGWFYQTPTAIECKPRAGLGAIGQMSSYQQWYRTIFGRDISGLIVCSGMSRQCQTAALWHNIRVVIVPPAQDFMVLNAERYVAGMIQKKSILPQFNSVQNF